MQTCDYYMQKWNLQQARYEEYTKPEDSGWYCPIYCNDLDEPVNCSECGKKLVYGDTFTSRFIHNKTGFGYPVCYECSEVEFKLEQEHKKKMKNDCK